MSNWVYLKLFHEIDYVFFITMGIYITKPLVEFHNNLDISGELYDTFQAELVLIILLQLIKMRQFIAWIKLQLIH